jgi:hypothetical protein
MRLGQVLFSTNKLGELLVKTLSLAAGAAFAVAVIAFSPSVHAADCPVGATCPKPQIAAYPPAPTPAPAVVQPQPDARYSQPYQPNLTYKPADDRYPGPAPYNDSGE